MSTIFHTDIAKALAQLPERQQSLLKNHGATQSLSYLPADLIKRLSDIEQLSLEELGLSLLALAASFAVAPVSDFKVGAVVFDSDGNAYLGANFEFTAVHIAQTVHAEQSAIANAWACGARDLDLLVINYPPCGHCRQFINEVNLSNNFRIQLPERAPQSLEYYLPEAFGPADLGVETRLLHEQMPNADSLSRDLSRNLSLLAKNACHNSHAPYSHSYSGIALQYQDGDIVVGRYAENAAFNPSLPPLQMALNSRRLQGKNWRSIKKAIMVEKATTLSQKENTQLMLNAIADTQLIWEYISE